MIFIQIIKCLFFPVTSYFLENTANTNDARMNKTFFVGGICCNKYREEWKVAKIILNKTEKLFIDV